MSAGRGRGKQGKEGEGTTSWAVHYFIDMYQSVVV